MKNDLVIVGGGPAGLMAAKTAAEDGLKVLLVERKRVVTHIDRACTQVTVIKRNLDGTGLKYAFLEPICLEQGTDYTRVSFPNIGFSVDYSGPIRPYNSWISMSPSGYRIYKWKDRFFGFFWSKEALQAELLASAEKAGVKVMTETLALGAENTSAGARVRIRTKSGEATIEAKRLIAADGWKSKIVESLGFNKNPPTERRFARVLAYILEGVESEYRLGNVITATVPSLIRSGPISICMMQGDTYELVTGAVDGIGLPAAEALDRFMKLPAYAPWFRNARILRKIVYGGPLGLQQTLIQEPAIGNVLIISDACGLEASNPGAIACGYKAAKAVLKELDGKDGYGEYSAWYQQAFPGLLPIYQKQIGAAVVFSSMCSDEEVDYLYKMCNDEEGEPRDVIGHNLWRVKNDRPELYQRLKKTGIDKGLEKQKIDASIVY